MRLERRELLKAAVLAAGVGALESSIAAAMPQIGQRKQPRDKVQPIARYGHSTALLQTGWVLVIGGLTEDGTLASCQIYDPNGDCWYEAAPLARARGNHSATRMPDGRIAVLGGYDGGALALASFYDPLADKWEKARPLLTPRYKHTAQALFDGRVVLTGGYNIGLLADAEVWSE
ncbi:MAG TPA: kelch repeat-containing protein [Fimbriimonas sp.]|nr:kelch repeat-containing protein [Fimbriimonas sp.]